MFEWLKIILNKLGVKPYIVRLYVDHFYKRFRMLLHYRRQSMFRSVTIETSSYCNRKCPACPVSVAPRIDKMYMEEQDYEKILNDLGCIKYTGRIALHFFNEPLEDKKVVSKVCKAHDLVPGATIAINSNGDYLNNELLAQLKEAGLNSLYVTAYSDNALKRLNNITQNATTDENNILEIRRAPKFIGNRAGTLDTIEINETLVADCYLPSSEFVINYKSQVVICCDDYFEKVVLGNIKHNSLLDIWYGQSFGRIRDTLKRKNRKAIATCVQCNFYCTPIERRALTTSEIRSYNKGELKLR